MHALALSVAEVNTAMTKSIPPLLILHVSGIVPSSGWSDPTLVPAVYIVAPDDGIWDFQLMAKRPAGIALPVLSPIHAELVIELPTWCRGVRIAASTNKIEQSLFKDSASTQDFLLDPGQGAQSLEEARREGIDSWPWLVSPAALAGYESRKAALLAKDKGREEAAATVDSIVGRKLRVVRHGGIFTQEIDPDRVTFLLDREGRIEHWLPH